MPSGRFFAERNGRIFLTGNCHPAYRDAPKWDIRYRQAFEWIAPYGRRRINGHNVLLSHYPYQSDHTEAAREMQWRLPDMGEFLLHGHTHSDQIWTSEREIHVGYDAWRRLVPEYEIAAMLEGAMSHVSRSFPNRAQRRCAHGSRPSQC